MALFDERYPDVRRSGPVAQFRVTRARHRRDTLSMWNAAGELTVDEIELTPMESLRIWKVLEDSDDPAERRAVCERVLMDRANP